MSHRVSGQRKGKWKFSVFNLKCIRKSAAAAGGKIRTICEWYMKINQRGKHQQRPIKILMPALERKCLCRIQCGNSGRVGEGGHTHHKFIIQHFAAPYNILNTTSQIFFWILSKFLRIMAI